MIQKILMLTMIISAMVYLIKYLVPELLAAAKLNEME